MDPNCDIKPVLSSQSSSSSVSGASEESVCHQKNPVMTVLMVEGKNASFSNAIEGFLVLNWRSPFTPAHVHKYGLFYMYIRKSF